MGLIIHVDGGSRGNPGPAGAGVRIAAADGTLIFEGAYYLGRQTNNAAEYHAVIRALTRAQQCGDPQLTVFSDSELLVRQITGEYEVKSPNLIQLYRQVQLLLLRVPNWSFRHVRREENTRADELANLAMDRKRDSVVYDAAGESGNGSSSDAEASVDDDDVPAPASEDVSDNDIIGPEERAVSITVARSPKAGACPAGLGKGEFVVQATLPAGMCVHAAHALLPTVLAILNTDAEEFAAVPTMTVRCGRPGCGATFQVSAVRSPNGRGHRKRRKP
ncbi:MAG: ribonuclease HI family protein [Phycisphaerae bacterium]